MAGVSMSKTTRVVLVGAVLLLALILSIPNVAARPATTGTRLNVSSCAGPSTANTPFFVQHGWFTPGWSSDSSTNRSAFNRGTTTFRLLLNNVVQKTANNFSYDSATDTKFKLFLRNFPSGLPAGNYTFKGEWYLDGLLVGGVSGTSVLQFDSVCTFTFS